MKRACFDIETDGLLDTVTKVHVLRVKVGTESYRWIGEEIPQGLAFLDTCHTIVAHNAIGFDLMALWVVYRWKPKAEVVDTLTLSCLVHPDIFGGHSLDEWGKRLGCPKLDYKAAYIAWMTEQSPDYRYVEGDEWLEFNPVMDDYCAQDCEVLQRLDNQLQADMATWDWTASAKMEHQFAKDFARQAWRGVAIDVPHATALLEAVTKEMEELEAEVEPLLPDRPGTKGEINSARPPKQCFKKDGTPTANTSKWFDEVRGIERGEAIEGWEGLKYGVWHRLPTPMGTGEDEETRAPLIDRFPMQLKDQVALKAWLMECGWRPTMWSYQKKADKNGKLRVVRGDDGQPIPTQPKFHEKGELCKNLQLVASDFTHVNQCIRWVILRHRRGFIAGVLENLRGDGTVSATGMALGTPTSRVTHQIVANVPKADKGVVLGKEMRAMFSARPNRKFVGVDAAGLELRCLAHYARNQELVQLVIADKDKGELDIHTVLAQGYAKVWPTITRSSGKNITYGLLYGASDKKVGETAGAPDSKTKKVGEGCRQVFFEGLPGMDGLMRQVERAAKVGHIKAIDGRRIAIRSKHATLNTLLQSCGSILVKWAQCYMNAKIAQQRLDAWQVISYHDEVQLDCRPEHAAAAGQLFIEGLQWAGKRFKFFCPLDGEVKIGANWAETH